MVDGHETEQLWLGVPLKHLSLATLTIQNSASILLMHYSRVMPLINGHRYITSTAVLLNEVLKLAFCLTIALYDISRNLPPALPATALFQSLYDSVFTLDSWKLAIPALLFTLQNSMQYVAVSNLDAATVQVTYQLKIWTTALFSVMLLKRSLSTKKWTALFLLTVGIAIVQLHGSSETHGLNPIHDSEQKFHFVRTIRDLTGKPHPAKSHFSLGDVANLVKRSATYEGIQEDQRLANPTMNPMIGLGAIVVACLSSGLAGVYFEKVLKDSTTSLWVRNVQLSFYSLFPALILGVILKDGDEVERKGFFVGYNWVVWAAITSQAVGGIAVSIAIAYADNIAKNFATSISIILSFVASIWLFGFQASLAFLVGTSVVLGATYLYSAEDLVPPVPIRLARYEKTTISRGVSHDNLASLRLQPPGMFTDSRDLNVARPRSPLGRFHMKNDSGGSASGRA